MQGSYNYEAMIDFNTRKVSVIWRPCSPSFCRAHLFSALFFFEKSGKPVMNLPMK